MNNTFTLTNDAIETLRKLIAEIDYEESMDDEDEDFSCNEDLVIENLYKICDIVRVAILKNSADEIEEA